MGNLLDGSCLYQAVCTSLSAPMAKAVGFFRRYGFFDTGDGIFERTPCPLEIRSSSMYIIFLIPPPLYAHKNIRTGLSHAHRPFFVRSLPIKIYLMCYAFPPCLPIYSMRVTSLHGVLVCTCTSCRRGVRLPWKNRLLSV